ncbi:hypothetical protein G2W53_008809 [Senna tora]|uniref:Uncharacterized protein n=1 Tax=Senna tora TaxID=362788 RepID=A0A834WX48_9FABA|nr:hypothetical protein G2W53_008809 [Senna tora]
MVSKVEEAMKSRNNKEEQVEAQEKQIMMHYQCNKGKKGGKFKRSTSNIEQDGASSAILFLACIACTPHFHIPTTTT